MERSWSRGGWVACGNAPWGGAGARRQISKTVCLSVCLSGGHPARHKYENKYKCIMEPPAAELVVGNRRGKRIPTREPLPDVSPEPRDRSTFSMDEAFKQYKIERRKKQERL